MRMNPMVLRFNERRATEAAARFLKLRGGKMSYLKLIKLLYLLDREALLRWGRPVTTDRNTPTAPPYVRKQPGVRDRFGHLSCPVKCG
jgi:hypothetical protein